MIETRHIGPSHRLDTAPEVSRFSSSPSRIKYRSGDSYLLANIGRRKYIQPAKPLRLASTCFTLCEDQNKWKMTVPQILEILRLYFVKRPCRIKVATVMKALKHLKGSSIPANSLKAIVEYLMKLMKAERSRVRFAAMFEFTKLAMGRKSQLSAAQINEGAKVMRLIFKSSNARRRFQALYFYRTLLSRANLSSSEIKAAGPALRELIDNEKTQNALFVAYSAYATLCSKRWAKKISSKERAAGLKSMRKAMIRCTRSDFGVYSIDRKTKENYSPQLAYRDTISLADTKTVNAEVRASLKMAESREVDVHKIGYKLLDEIIEHHVNNTSITLVKRWEKFLWSKLRSYEQNGVDHAHYGYLTLVSYSELISRYKGKRLDKAVLRLTKYVYGEYASSAIAGLKILFPKLGEKTKKQIVERLKKQLASDVDEDEAEDARLALDTIQKIYKP